MTNSPAPAQELCRHTNSAVYHSSGLHCHDCYELFIHVRGASEFCIGQDRLPLLALEVFVIRPGQRHGFPAGETIHNYEALELHLTEELLTELGWRGYSLQQALERIADAPGQHIMLNQEAWRTIHPLAAGVKDDAPSLHPAERQISLGCLSTLLGIICYVGSLGIVPYLTRNTTSQTIRHVADHLAQFFTDDCSLSQLAEKFNMSKYHLSHSFTKAFGMSPHQYMLKCRITYAKRLIRQGEALSSIAAACGFNDYSTFLRTFSKQEGMTPSEWKEQHSHLSAANK